MVSSIQTKNIRALAGRGGEKAYPPGFLRGGGQVGLSLREANEMQIFLPRLLVVFPSGSDQACP